MPKVSVLLSIYNGERFLKEAIESILVQTFKDFEFIIINDGSTDKTGAILADYQQSDPRIRVFDQENRGLIASLNRGCRLAQAAYIARMDADDISLPDRIAMQVDAMESHPEIGILGSAVEFIDEKGVPNGQRFYPNDSYLVGWTFLFGNNLAHPSVMMKRGVVDRVGYYRREALYVEDYDLWVRASKVTRIANISRILLQRRNWTGSISSCHLQMQEQNVVKIMFSIAEGVLRSEVSIETITMLRQVFAGSFHGGLLEIESLIRLIRKLCRMYVVRNSLSDADARKIYRDAGRKIGSLGVLAARFSILKAFLIFVQGLRLGGPALLLSDAPKVLLKKFYSN
jgi:glycosyltransferase involved in cell wall biosynthesis